MQEEESKQTKVAISILGAANGDVCFNVDRLPKQG